MFAIFKWLIVLLLAGLAWVIAVITAEYFRPYQKVRIHLR